jgi:hypothetical protein
MGLGKAPKSVQGAVVAKRRPFVPSLPAGWFICDNLGFFV